MMAVPSNSGVLTTVQLRGDSVMPKIRGVRQSAIRLMALVLVVALFAACAAPVAPAAPAASEGQTGEQATSEAAPATEGSPVEVVFWNQHSNPVDVAAIEQIVADFNAANPDVAVEIVPVPGDETDVTKLMTAVRG